MKSLYIASHEKSAGSLVVSMGMMEFLKARFRRVAFFRPFVEDKKIDHDIDFFLKRYSLDIAYEQTFGFSIHEAEKLIAKNKLEFLIKELIAKVKLLENDYDFVLIEGLNESSFSNTIEFNINLEIAKNFGVPYSNVLKGNNKSADELLDEILIDHEHIKSSGCMHFATFVNRLDKGIKEELSELLKKYAKFSPICLMSEVEELDKPTIYEVKRALHCQVVKAKPSDYRRVVRDSKIAAMQLENFLDYIEDGDLILVSADRADIVVGSILAIYSKRYPNISGIILTGGMSLSFSILKILDGFDNFPVPIFSTNYDTYETAIRVNQISPNIDAKNERKVALAMGLFNASVNSYKLNSKIYEAPSSMITPAMFEYGLFQKALENRKKVVLPEALDERILQACEILLRREIVDIILLGDGEEILQKSGSLGLDISKAIIINPNYSKYRKRFAKEFYKLRKDKGMSLAVAYDIMGSVSYFATMMVHLGIADGMVSGAIHTTQETIRPALQIIKTKPNISIVSSLFFMSLKTKVLVYADCAVNQDPTAEELATIAITSADTAVQFGISPKIAMLSYSTGSSGKGKDVQKVAEATRIVKKRRADLLVEGPIQYDAAIDKEVAKTKLPNSKVAGEANIFIFPDLNTGNNTYKAVQRSSGAVAIGPVLQGLKKPINDLSRGCLVADIINTVAITAIQAQESKS
ncbi:Phosphate acetyltransferase [hydrothermal vent metagenome]|uniref:Phosphate acetyltransferase n=1 Tax=hydrothermal vent metagenome TaxID=652676 RepID=A0A1W1BRJ1_9ZZZZ